MAWSGRRYAGEVQQIITGSIGFDDWEWGVDLFADDPLVFKKLIYEMRFDEVSATYALVRNVLHGTACSRSKARRSAPRKSACTRAGTVLIDKSQGSCFQDFTIVSAAPLTSTPAHFSNSTKVAA